MSQEVSQQALHLQKLASYIPRTRKQRFLRQMSEDDFRDKVVRPLFLQQGYTDGRETCGPNEQGKDCYFTKTAELSGTDVFVVQTKVGKINKAANARDNLDNLVAQLRTALETNVLLVADKKKRMPLAGYLVASGEINDAARHHIVDRLSDSRLKFLDVEELIPLIDKHIPQLWLDIESDSISYFRAITHAVERGGDLLSAGVVIADANTNACVMDDAYITVNVFRVRVDVPAKGRRRKKQSDPGMLDRSFPATSLLNEHDRLLLIVGDGGSGKTML
jgi:Restriction endonuclease